MPLMIRTKPSMRNNTPFAIYTQSLAFISSLALTLEPLDRLLIVRSSFEFPIHPHSSQMCPQIQNRAREMDLSNFRSPQLETR